MGRYIRQLKGGAVTRDKGRIRADSSLDGKDIISTSDDTLTAEDVALGYKQLLEVERAFGTIKTTLELRPVYHRKDDRIRAHFSSAFLPCFWCVLRSGRPAAPGIRSNRSWSVFTWENFFKNRACTPAHRADP
ncbi:MAG TPA: hypothetical protein PLS81_11910 [Deltaproteobacteria bacterium]|nr:hypothetical protein [Deltaproteobacteria bacterium]